MTLNSGPTKKERKKWRIADALLLDPNIQVINSPTLKRILKGYPTLVALLEIIFKEGTVSCQATREKFLILYKKIFDIEEDEL